MLSKQEVLERAFRAIEGLKAKPEIVAWEGVERSISPPRHVQAPDPEPILAESLDAPETGTLVEVACRCSARPYPHIHSPEDQRLAIVAWNRDSTHKIEPIH